MKKRIMTGILTGVMLISLAGCTGSKPEPETPAQPSAPEEPAQDQTQETPGDSELIDKLRELASGGGTDEASAETADTGEYILIRYGSDSDFYTVDASGRVTGTYNRQDLSDHVGGKGSKFVNIANPENEYNTSEIIGVDDRFMYFSDYELYGDDTLYTYVVYAVDLNTYAPYIIWRSKPGDGDYIDACEYYDGSLHLAINGSRDDDGNVARKTESCYRFNDAEGYFEETSAGLEDIFSAAAVRNYNVLTPTGYNGSSHMCYAHTLDQNGWILALDDSGYAAISADGTVTPLDGLPGAYLYVPYYDTDYIYFADYDDDYSRYTFNVYDISTDKYHPVTDLAGMLSYLGYSDGTVYYYNDTSEKYGYTQNTIYAYDPEKDKAEVLYVADSVMGAQFSPGVDAFRIIGGRIYYVTLDGDELTWVSADAHTAGDKAKAIGCPVQKLNVFAYGKVDADSVTEACPYCGTVIYKCYAENFVLDGKYSSYADRINASLLEKRKAFLGSVTDDEYYPEDDSDCDYHREYPDQNCVSDELNIGDVKIICDHFLIVNMDGYWYAGGAHGYPNRVQSVYDLDTGDEVTLADIYTGTEEDFKALIAAKTREDYQRYSEENCPYFAGSAADVYDQAYEYASLETTQIEFGEDGVTLLYPPYEMGSYASGFIEVEISYRDLLGRDSL